jgi:nicotinamidase-related amidase
MKIAMMTRWNATCGISAHAELVGGEWLKKHDLTVFAPTLESATDWHHNPIEKEDEEFVIRGYEQPKRIGETGWIDKRLWKKDYIIERKRFSAFYNTKLETLLRSMDKRTLLICGVITNVCIEATLWSAVDRDFNVIILSDCTASHSKEAQEFPMREVFPFIATVAASNELEIKECAKQN